jgi:hypothetical protein
LALGAVLIGITISINATVLHWQDNREHWEVVKFDVNSIHLDASCGLRGDKHLLGGRLLLPLRLRFEPFNFE